MFKTESELLYSHKQDFADQISKWVELNYPERTTEHEKCARDVRYVIQALVFCLNEGNIFAADHISTMFYTNKTLQLKSTYVEFAAYDLLLEKIYELFPNNIDAVAHCREAINVLKSKLTQ